MKASRLALTLAAAVAQGAAFAAVSRLLGRREHLRGQHDGRLEDVENRLTRVEQLLQAQPGAFYATVPVPLPASNLDADAPATRPFAAPATRRPAAFEAPPEEFPRVRPAASYLDEGAVYFEVGNYERAADRFARAIDLQPELSPAYFNRALALSRLGRFDEALCDYDRAATLAPGDADIFNNRGLLRLERDDLPAAAADFERALALQPDDADARANLALVREQMTAG